MKSRFQQRLAGVTRNELEDNKDKILKLKFDIFWNVVGIVWDVFVIATVFHYWLYR